MSPAGEKPKRQFVQKEATIPVDTYAGRVYIDWDHDTSVTALGQLAFFIEFLKRTELFEQWVARCPLELTSPNAPKTRDILGTILLSVLSGHTRYSHITTVRTDKVNAPLLGMTKIVSEDSVRRALIKLPELESKLWLISELKNCYLEILHLPWILDVDTTVKCLYGHQEGAVVGYNPKKPGRPSHTYHTYMIANIRMILDVEVMPGNEGASSHTLPHLFSWLDSLPEEKRPHFIRGDCAFGSDGVMKACEERELRYLFKLKQTQNIKRLISEKMVSGEWENAGQGWQGCEGKLKLMARIIALIYNWWTLFVRLIDPNTHLEVITSRPLLLHAVGKQIQHAGQKIIQVSSSHGKFKQIKASLVNLSAFFKTLKPCAEQLSRKERMRRVLYRAFKKFVTPWLPDPPTLLPKPA